MVGKEADVKALHVHLHVSMVDIVEPLSLAIVLELNILEDSVKFQFP